MTGKQRRSWACRQKWSCHYIMQSIYCPVPAWQLLASSTPFTMIGWLPVCSIVANGNDCASVRAHLADHGDGTSGILPRAQWETIVSSWKKTLQPGVSGLASTGRRHRLQHSITQAMRVSSKRTDHFLIVKRQRDSLPNDAGRTASLAVIVVSGALIASPFG